MSRELPEIPGILLAVEQHRVEDALALIQQTFQRQPPEIVVAVVANEALALRSTPAASLQTMALVSMASESGIDIDGSTVTRGTIAGELLDVLEGRDGLLDTDETRAILDRFDYRPGSATTIGMVCTLIGCILANIELQVAVADEVLRRRSAKAVIRSALDSARRALVHGDPAGATANLFSPDFDDL